MKDKRSSPSQRPSKAKNGKRRKPRSGLPRAIPATQVARLLHRISDGFITLDRDWRYVYVNQQAAVMLQRKKPADLIGKHIWTEYPEGVGQPFHLAYEKAMREQVPLVIEEYYEPWDRWFENRIYPSKDALCIFFTEITERKRGERELRTSKERLQAAVDAADLGLWDWNLATGEIVWLGHHDKLFGLKEGEFDGSYASFEKRVHPDDLEALNQAVESARVEHSDYSHEYRTIWPDGSIHWMDGIGRFVYDDAGEPVHMYGAVMDRTLQHRAEEAVRESEAKFWKIFYGTPVPTNITRVSDGVYVEVNDSFLQRLGFKREEVIGRNSAELGLWAEPEERPEMLNRLLTQGFLRNYEARFQTKSGQLGTALLFRDVVEIGGQKHYIGTSLDITERKEMEEALKLSEERYRAVVENQTEFIVRWRPDGVRTFANEAYRKYFGLSHEETTSEGFISLIVEEDRPAVQEKVFRLLSGAVSAETDIHRVIRADGSTGWQEWIDQAIYDDAGHLVEFQSVGRDITERKRAELEITRLLQESQRRLKQVESLHAIDLAISGSMELRTTLHLLLRHVDTLLEVDAADILLFDPVLEQFRYAAGRGFRTNAVMRAAVPFGGSLAGRAALERKRVIVSGGLAAQNDPDFASMYEREGFQAYAGVPLVAKGQIKGVLEVYHRSVHHPEIEWLDLLETLAGQAAIAVDNAQLFNELQQSNVDLALAYDATIAGWSRAMDLRDKETEGHTQRVTDLTLKLARTMQVSEHLLTHMRRGALLHDIGKMGVPDSILLKNEALTDEEWMIMRRHPEFAHEMLSSIPYLKPALDIPYAHHERWDGTGYPRGLKGEDIPLAARIFAVVDVWDALRSDRPYRASLSESEAGEYLRSESGKHFDPQIVEAFFRLQQSEGAAFSSFS